VRSAALPGFLTAVDNFAAAMTKAGDKAVVQQAMSSAQSYAYSENKDLYDFASLVVGSTKSSDVKAKGNALMSYITGTLVGDNKTSGSYDKSHGIAIYIPGAAAPSSYADLAWAKASTWDDFINWSAK
jgi:hypothetical protein